MNPLFYAVIWWQWMLAPQPTSGPTGGARPGGRVIDYRGHERARRRWQPWQGLRTG